MYTKLISDIERALTRLQSHYGDKLTLSVGKIVTPAAHKNSHVRVDTDHKEDVSISSLEHVSVFRSDANGLCIRLIFNGKLFAVSGQYANMLKLWSVKASELKARQIIDRFPEMRFHTVPGKVRLEGAGKQKEIVMAYA